MQKQIRFVRSGGTSHRLSFVLRPSDHFSGQPVPHLLQVGLRGFPKRPVIGPDGSERQADGSYRFIDLENGDYEVYIRDTTGRWTTFGASLNLRLPISVPTRAVVQTVWPTPAQTSAPGETVLRSRIIDTATRQPLPGRRIEIGPAGGPWNRHSFSDADGELFFPLSESVAPQADGTLRLEVRVDEGATTVNQVQANGSAPTAGALFTVQPGRETRLRLRVTG